MLVLDITFGAFVYGVASRWADVSFERAQSRDRCELRSFPCGTGPFEGHFVATDGHLANLSRAKRPKQTMFVARACQTVTISCQVSSSFWGKMTRGSKEQVQSPLLSYPQVGPKTTSTFVPRPVFSWAGPWDVVLAELGLPMFKPGCVKVSLAGSDMAPLHMLVWQAGLVLSNASRQRSGRAFQDSKTIFKRPVVGMCTSL